MKLLPPIMAKSLSPPLPFSVLWKNLDGKSSAHPLICSWHPFHSGVRPRRLWNLRGRETLRVEKCQTFASQLAGELCKKKSIPLVARHYKLQLRWFPSTNTECINSDEKVFCELRDGAVNYLSDIMSPNFAGAVQLDSYHEIELFLIALLAYPTVFSHQSIYLFSMTVPLVVELNHHADVMFYSTMMEFQPEMMCKKRKQMIVGKGRM